MDTMTNPMDQLHGYYFEDLEEGMTDIFAKTITDADIITFAGISGDTNPVHLNHEFASETIFEGRIAHGMLSAGFISTIFGTIMPGRGSIYMSQNLKFTAPVRHGDLVRAIVEVVDITHAKKRVLFNTRCFVGDTMVVDGDALIMVPSRA